MSMRVEHGVPKGTAKGVCYLCNAAPRRVDVDEVHPNGRELFVDTRIHIDYEGKLGICETCILNMALLCGYATPRLVAKYEAEITRLRAANDQLTEIAGKHTRLIAALDEAGLSSGHDETAPDDGERHVAEKVAGLV